MKKAYRLVFGLLLLLLMDVLWILNSSLNNIMYPKRAYAKPFFCAYVKTSMLSVYLLRFLFTYSWKPRCTTSSNNNYIYVNLAQHDDDEDGSTETNDSLAHLSNPIYVPVKVQEAGSVSESEDTCGRAVRFNKLAEVRHMAEAEATEALLARLSYHASLNANELARRAADEITADQALSTAVQFWCMSFLASYCRHLAIICLDEGIVNLLISLSTVFTLVISSMHPSNMASDRFYISNCLTVIISIIGVMLMTNFDLKMGPHPVAGTFVSLISALIFSIYLVSFRRKIDQEEKLNIPLFCGYSGFLTMITMWPIFIVNHFGGLELFELPDRHEFAFLLVNGIFSTVISEVLLLWGCAMTSSLMTAMAVPLVIPLTLLANIFIKQERATLAICVGTFCTLSSFIATACYNHCNDSDPIFKGLLWLYTKWTGHTRITRFSHGSEQCESLIPISSEHEA